jgi:hypothetical protein
MACRGFVVLTALLFASIGTLHADGDWVIRKDGVGPAKVGMTLAQLNAALGERFTKPSEKGEEGEGGDACFYVKTAKHPHLSFMIEDGRLSRVDVDAPGIRTTEGSQVGDSEAKVQKVYGSKLKVEPGAYGGRYLTVRSPDGHYGIRFETDEAKITGFYAGQFKTIQYVEGCL